MGTMKRRFQQRGWAFPALHLQGCKSKFVYESHAKLFLML